MARTGSVEFEMTQDQLAEMLGVGRTFVTGIVSQLRQEGVLETKRGVIIVKDEPADGERTEYDEDEPYEGNDIGWIDPRATDQDGEILTPRELEGRLTEGTTTRWGRPSARANVAFVAVRLFLTVRIVSERDADCEHTFSTLARSSDVR
jgi:hypothetical protein